MATWILFRSRFPFKAPEEWLRLEAPDLATAHAKFGEATVGVANIAKTQRDAQATGARYWVQSAASVALSNDTTKRGRR